MHEHVSTSSADPKHYRHSQSLSHISVERTQYQRGLQEAMQKHAVLFDKLADIKVLKKKDEEHLHSWDEPESPRYFQVGCAIAQKLKRHLQS